MITLILFLGLSTTIWCDQLPRVDPHKRIQKHVIGKAAIFDGEESKSFNLHLEELFSGEQLKEAWDFIYLDCLKTGISDEIQSDIISTAIPMTSDISLSPNDQRKMKKKRQITKNLNQTAVIPHKMKISHYFQLLMDLKELFYKFKIPNAIFKTEDMKRFLKKIWHINEKNEDYLKHLIPHLTIKPTQCFTKFKTIILNVTYPVVTELGHGLQVWDAGRIFQDIYFFALFPSNVIQVDNIYYSFVLEKCSYQNNAIFCHQHDTKRLDECNPDNYKSCELDVSPVKGTIYRTWSNRAVIATEFANYTLMTSSTSTVHDLNPRAPHYFTLGSENRITIGWLTLSYTPSYMYGKLVEHPFSHVEFNYTNDLTSLDLNELNKVMAIGNKMKSESQPVINSQKTQESQNYKNVAPIIHCFMTLLLFIFI